MFSFKKEVYGLTYKHREVLTQQKELFEKKSFVSKETEWLKVELIFSQLNNRHEKISPFWLVKSSAVFF